MSNYAIALQGLYERRDELQKAIHEIEAAIALTVSQLFEEQVQALRVEAQDCRVVWEYSDGKNKYGSWKSSTGAFATLADWLRRVRFVHEREVIFQDGKAHIPRARMEVTGDVSCDVYIEAKS